MGEYYEQQMKSYSDLTEPDRAQILAKVRQNAHLFYDEGWPFPALKGVEADFKYRSDKLGHSVSR